MSFYSLFNNIEGILWLFVAATIAIRTPRNNSQQKAAVVLAVVAFVLFGLTDFIEAHYEARVPLWLYAWKIACGSAIFTSRYTWLGWTRFHWTDREFLFAIACMIAIFAIMVYQYS